MAAEAMTRRVYVLSGTLAGKVRAFAAQRHLSEVAAVRQLLRESLDQRESGAALETRVRLMLVRAGMTEVLETLAAHPQVATLTKMPRSALVECADGHCFTVAEVGHG